MLETAVTLVAFMAFFFMLINVGRMCYDRVALQFAVEEGARWGAKGNDDGSGRSQSIRNKTSALASALGVGSITVTLKDADGNDTAGAPGEFLFVSAESSSRAQLLPIPFLDSDKGKYAVRAAVWVQNEMF